MAATSPSIPPQFTAMNKPQCFYNQSIAFFYNRSGKHLATEWNTVGKLSLFVSSIMLANLLVMVAIYVNRHFHFPVYHLMANLAAADFFAGLAYFYLIRLIMISRFHWVENGITVFHMQLHTRMSNCVDWNCICNTENFFWAIFNLVTFVVMVVLCAHIFGYVCQRTMRMSQHSSGPQWNRDIMMSLLKTMVIVLGAFIICWTSGLALLILDVCYPQCSVLPYEKFFLLLVEFNSAMNPIIYSYHDKEMSSTFRQILCCQCSENPSSPTEGSDRSASSLNHTILAGVHSNDHSVV
uniref:Lysophosphatidic acid receptor 1 n=1 Tax=Cebus imitator TaxID=2715852 RepID=A0A2K5RFC0_CEBIM